MQKKNLGGGLKSNQSVAMWSLDMGLHHGNLKSACDSF